MQRQLVTFKDIERRHLTLLRGAYYAWIRRIVMLAVGCLTILVSLKNNYYPANLPAPPLLKACWAGLGLSILLGVVALHGEIQTRRDALNNLSMYRKEYGDQMTGELMNRNVLATSPRWIYTAAEKGLFLSFAFALVCLSLFAILNL